MAFQHHAAPDSGCLRLERDHTPLQIDAHELPINLNAYHDRMIEEVMKFQMVLESHALGRGRKLSLMYCVLK